MLKVIIQSFVMLGTWASLIGAILIGRPTDQPLSCFQWILFGVASALLIVAVTYEVAHYILTRPTLFKSADQRGINDFMRRWIGGSGRVAVFSHDLTWVDERARRLLETKAQRNELEVFVPKRTGNVAALLDELERRGAAIYIYPELEYVPRSRFTIVNRGRVGPRVAVGRAVGDKWRIDIFSEGEDPVFAVANDLIEVIVNLNRARAAGLNA